jgi:PAS domain S-box-containing protein
MTIKTTPQSELDEILNGMSDIFFSLDEEWKIIRANKNFLEYSKIPWEKQVGKNFLELYLNYPKAKNSLYWLNYHKAMGEKVVVEFEDYYPESGSWTKVQARPRTEGGLNIFVQDITAKKLAAERNVDVLESMSDAFFSIDANWIITNINSHHEKSTRLKREDQIGKNLLELFFSSPESKISKYWISYHKAMEERIPVFFEEYYPPIDLWTLVRAYPTSDGGIAVFFTDTSEQKRINQRLEVEKLKFEAIFAVSPAAMTLVRGPDFIYEKVNPKYKETMGGRDIVGKPMLEALPELINQPFHSYMKKVFETGVTFVGKEVPAYLNRHPDKGNTLEEVFFDFTYTRINDSEGKPYGIYTHAFDITDKVLARRQVEEGKRKLQLALDSGHMGTWNIDLITNISTASPETCNIFGVAEINEEFTGFLEKMIHPEDKEVVFQAFNMAIEAQKPYEHEYRIIRSDGQVRWVISQGIADIDFNGVLIAYSGVIQDITDRKNSEDRAETLLIENQEALRARDEFLSIASHELKTPLTSLKLKTQQYYRAIKKNDPDIFSPKKVQDLLSLTEAQVLRITRLVDDMLDVSRIRSGHLNIERESFDLRDLIEEVFNRLKAHFDFSGYKVPQFIHEGSFAGNWDRLRIEQVITNLLTNAIRYGRKNPITVALENRGEVFRISVEDQGIGIEEHTKEIIFNRFSRAVNANEVSGLGLGLFITKQIVIAHGGKIWVESTLGVGSKFIVELPK